MYNCNTVTAQYKTNSVTAQKYKIQILITKVQKFSTKLLTSNQ